MRWELLQIIFLLGVEIRQMEKELLEIFRTIGNTNLKKIGLDQLRCLASMSIN